MDEIPDKHAVAQYLKELEIMKQWFPLILQGRDKKDVIAASRIDRGTEMNFGSLTKQLYNILENTYNTKVSCNKEVVDVDPSGDEDWALKVNDVLTNENTFIKAKHVFIGAGGGSLTLLEKVEIEEKDGYGGFPISGEWLVCKNEKIINQLIERSFHIFNGNFICPNFRQPRCYCWCVENRRRKRHGTYL